MPNEISFTWRSTWRNKVARKVAFLVWAAAVGKILTIDNVIRGV